MNPKGEQFQIVSLKNKVESINDHLVFPKSVLTVLEYK